jgi:hypothetical protein
MTNTRVKVACIAKTDHDARDWRDGGEPSV